MHPLVKMVTQRLALGVVTLFVITLIIFFAIELLPGHEASHDHVRVISLAVRHRYPSDPATVRKAGAPVDPGDSVPDP